jgi:uncharacterized protein (DUF3820 family)
MRLKIRCSRNWIAWQQSFWHNTRQSNNTPLSKEAAKAAPMMNADHLQLLVTREMPYGKYKGRLIADLPGHYLGWFAREGFPKGELGALLALMYELDHNALRHLLDPLRKR